MKSSVKIASLSLIGTLLVACGGGGTTTVSTPVAAPGTTTPAPAPTTNAPAPAPTTNTPAPAPTTNTPAPPAVTNASGGLPGDFSVAGFVTKGAQTFAYSNTQYALTTDGSNFQVSPTTQTGPGGFNIARLLNNKVVFVGGSANFSDTGAAPYAAISGLPANMVAQDVAFGAGRYVIVLQDRGIYPNTIYSSADLASGMTAATISQLKSWITVAFGNGKFVAITGSGGDVSTSTDGQNWTAPSAVIGGPVQKLAFASGMSGGLFVASANAGKLYTSPDGLTWTLRDSNLNANLTRIHCIPTHCVAVAGQSNNLFIAKSSNGVTWTTITTNKSSTQANVSHDGTRWLVGGDNGILFTSTDGENFTLVPTR